MHRARSEYLASVLLLGLEEDAEDDDEDGEGGAHRRKPGLDK
jgi:hypothetical protein